MFKKFTQLDSDLLQKQVDPLFEATRSGGLANIFAVWLVYALVCDTHHQEDAYVAGIAVTFLSVVRIVFSDEYLRSRSTGKNVKLYLGTHLSSNICHRYCMGFVCTYAISHMMIQLSEIWFS